MIYSIENEYLKVSADSFGGQLMSVYSKKTDTEYLWQGNPEFWRGRAYNLFPFIGRMTDGTYTYKGKEYKIKPHGLTRYYDLELFSKDKDKLIFLLRDSDETRKLYPFSFNYYVIFSLDKNVLNVTYKAVNTGDKEMIFAFGGHPGFNVPFDKGQFTDYYLEFDKAGKMLKNLMSPNYFISGEKEEFNLDDNKLWLNHRLFDNDAIILENTGDEVCICGRNTDRKIKVSYKGFKYVGFWHTVKMDAPFVCVEPWSALPAYEGKIDHLEQKENMFNIDSHKEKELGYKIEIME